MKWLPTYRLTRLLTVATSLLFGVQPCFPATENPTAVAPRTIHAAQSGGWIRVPDAFMVSHLVCPVGSPKRMYRVIVDAAPNLSGKKARPTIVRSCGEPAVDRMGLEYVSITLAASPKLAEQNRTKLLSFQMQLVPFQRALQPAKPRPSGTRPDMFVTPLPHYPYSARERHSQGDCMVRVTYPAAGGRPKEAVLVSSSGSNILDANSLLFILENWDAPPSPTRQDFVKTTEMDYRLY